MVSCVFVGILLLSFGAGRPSDITDASKVVDSIINKLDEYIYSNNLTEFKLPDVVDNQFFVKKLFQKGVLKDFSTFIRIGNATIDVQPSGGYMFNWVVVSNVGLQYLVVEYDFHFETFFGLIKYNGHLVMQVNMNVLDVEATIVVNRKQPSCTVVVNDLAVTKLEGFKVTISDGGFLKGVLEGMLRHYFSYVIPMLREGINNQLHEFIRTFPINQEITYNICKYFNPS